VPIVDHHDCIFSEKGRCVARIRDLMDFHFSCEEPRGNEILHHVIVPEIVLDRVGMLWASVLQELPEVICGRSCMTLATAYSSRGVHHAGAAHLLVAAAVVINRGCGLLTVLLVPLLAALGALLGILDDNVGRHFPAVAWGRVKCHI
jgi:hypothetical protein